MTSTTWRYLAPRLAATFVQNQAELCKAARKQFAREHRIEPESCGLQIKVHQAPGALLP